MYQFGFLVDVDPLNSARVKEAGEEVQKHGKFYLKVSLRLLPFPLRFLEVLDPTVITE